MNTKLWNSQKTLNSSITSSRTLQYALLVTLIFTVFSFYYSTVRQEFLGYPSRATIFLYDDVFADTIKSGFSFLDINDGYLETKKYLRLPQPIKNYIANNHYLSGVSSIEDGNYRLTNYVCIPGYAAISSGIAKLVKFGINPYAIYSVAGLIIIAAIIFFAYKLGIDRRNYFLILFLLVCSYPFWVILQRGHLQSAAILICILAYLINFYRNGSRTLIGLFALSIAIGIRPNAIIFLLIPILICDFKTAFLFSLKTILLSFVIFLSFYFLIRSYYPSYSFSNISEALKAFDHIFVHEKVSHYYSVALPSIFYLLFNKAVAQHAVILTITVNLLLCIAAYLIKLSGRKFNFTNTCFFTIIIFTLCNNLTYYYFSLFFILPILLVSADESNTPEFSKVYIVSICAFMLSYHFFDRIMGAVTALILFGSAVYILFLVLNKNSTAINHTNTWGPAQNFESSERGC